MAELKRNFLKGKMNKDLDERLVPNGEYRDALNIEITTSDDSDVGSAQTLRGNSWWQRQGLQYGFISELIYKQSTTSQTVGVYSDEENNHVYNFVAKDSDLANTIIELDQGPVNVLLGQKSDAIWQIKPHKSNPDLTETKLVVRDLYEVRRRPRFPGDSTTTIYSFTRDSYLYSNLDGSPSFSSIQGVRVGMRVQAIDIAGNDVYGAQNKIFVKSITLGGLVGTCNIVCTEIYDQQGLFTQAMSDAGVVLKFSEERILNFNPGSSSELEQNTDYPLVTRTPKNSYISAINVIGDFLFFTDGRTEPKKINIKRSIAGNPSIGLNSHTLLVIEKNKRLYARDYLKEEHITVLKPNPDLSPRAIPRGQSGANLQEILVWGAENNDITGNQVYGPWAFTNSSDQLYQANTNIYIQPQTPLDAPWEVNQIIELTGQDSSTTISVKVVDVFGDNPGPGAGYYTIHRITDINTNLNDLDSGVDYNLNQGDENWFARTVNKDKLYDRDFIRFSYRYAYTDGEFSAFAPFTPAAFIAGDYSYQARDGFNLGMANRADKIEVFDYVHDHTPRDVVKIQLIFKSQKSDNMYSFKTVDCNEGHTSDYVLRGLGDFSNIDASGWDVISFEIKEKVFGFTLPTDQQTRVFDAVPKKAVAQEIQANRLMYGNYTQDYDLLDHSHNLIIADINTRVRQNSHDNNTSTVNSPNVMGAYTDYRDFSILSGEEGGEGTAEDPFVYSEFPINNQVISNNPQGGFYTSLNIQMSGEYDPGNNFDSFTDNLGNGVGSSIYTVPVSGYYTIEAEARFVSKYFGGGTYDHLEAQRATTRLAVLPIFGGGNGNAGGQQATFLPGFAINTDPQDASNTVFSPWVSQTDVLQAAGALDYINSPSFELQFYEFFESNPNPADLGGPHLYRWAPGADHESWVLEIPPTTVYLHAGDLGHIGLFAQTEQDTSMIQSQISDVTFRVTAAPSEQTEIGGAMKGERSIKSLRNYNLGVVYRDKLGRESSVLIGKENDFSLGKALSKDHNSLITKANNNAPEWAETYKFFIKENTAKFENLVMEAAFGSQGQNYMYLVFNSVDRNKVKVGDYLVGKKVHNSNSYVDDANSKWRIISIIGDVDEDGTVRGDIVPTAISASTDELEGKFFVKVRNIDLVGEQNILGQLENPENDDQDVFYTAFDSNNGAVFEVEPDSQLDLDLYYEASDSYAIRLDRRNATKHIRNGMRVSMIQGYNLNSNLAWGANNNPKITRVVGALTFGAQQSLNFSEDACCTIHLDSAADVYIGPTALGHIVRIYNDEFGFKNDREFVEARLFGSIQPGDTFIKLRPAVHKINGSDPNVEIGLPWYNCISFGNGVESDTIRDDFNGTELFKYTASGKQSGFKANLTSENYAEYTYLNKIIFSQIYNETIGSNRFNEFLLADNIIKEINEDYGSIQKLYSRDSDLLTLCERKCLKILSKKDALFNADGNPQLLSSTSVLGQAIPFAGDYGISKNPESFTADEYRCYFTDKNRSAVIRLSMDGITPISDAGMKDWFKDQMVNTEAIIGSFDSSKEEYNLTLHEVLNSNNTKNVYTLSFNETIDGWSSFKSYTKEAGVTLNNVYYTFKNGTMFSHGETATNESWNNFYTKQYNSSITCLFNDSVSNVKTFRTINYEGTQANVDAFNDVVLDDVIYNDGEYYNLEQKDGWYIDYINTDLQDATSKGFKDKEGKWFSYIKGKETTHTNLIDGGTELTTNIDISEFSVQGLGMANSNVTLVDGDSPQEGFTVIVTPDFSYLSDEEV